MDSSNFITSSRRISYVILILPHGGECEKSSHKMRDAGRPFIKNIWHNIDPSSARRQTFSWSKTELRRDFAYAKPACHFNPFTAFLNSRLIILPFIHSSILFLIRLSSSGTLLFLIVSFLTTSLSSRLAFHTNPKLSPFPPNAATGSKSYNKIVLSYSSNRGADFGS